MGKDTNNHTQSNIVHNVHCDSHHKNRGQNIGSIASCITIVPIFNHLEEEQMQEIMNTTKSVSYKKSEVIYRAGDADDSLYIVSRGKIRIYRLSDSGKEQLVRILNPGDFTGELALFRESIHEAYAEAIGETDVCIMKRSDLQVFLLKYPTIALKILSEFSNRLERSEQQTTRVATEKVETRLALFIAECLGNGDSMEIELPMSQKDLASYLGTTPETVSRKLADLENDGYIKLKTGRGITILDLDGLLSV
jgi:CRP/FNR family transcriptional regulator